MTWVTCGPRCNCHARLVGGDGAGATATPWTVVAVTATELGSSAELTARPEVAVALAVVVPRASVAGVKLIGPMVWLINAAATVMDCVHLRCRAVTGHCPPVGSNGAGAGSNSGDSSAADATDCRCGTSEAHRQTGVAVALAVCTRGKRGRREADRADGLATCSTVMDWVTAVRRCNCIARLVAAMVQVPAANSGDGSATDGTECRCRAAEAHARPGRSHSQWW